MRMSRTISGFVAAGLIGLLPAAAPASAADQAHHAGRTSATHSSVDRAALPHRDISINIKKKSNRKFVISGKVAPKYQGRFLTVQRKFGGQKKWSKYKKVKTNQRSVYRAVVRPRSSVGRVYYRVKSTKTDQWATSYSPVVYIETSYA